MAATRLIPMHKIKNQSMSYTVHEWLDYAMNLDKTQGSELVTAYGCDPAQKKAAQKQRQPQQRQGQAAVPLPFGAAGGHIVLPLGGAWMGRESSRVSRDILVSSLVSVLTPCCTSFPSKSPRSCIKLPSFYQASEASAAASVCADVSGKLERQSFSTKTR